MLWWILFFKFLTSSLITFCAEFNSNVDLLQFTSLTQVTFGGTYNKKIKLLPPSLSHITFGESFNQPVDSLPPSLTHLTFRSFFNQSVDLLPPSLTHLTLGGNFNQSVNLLPPSLIHLQCSKATKTKLKRVSISTNVKITVQL